MSVTFSLHSSLAADTIPVAMLDLCEVRLMNDANFPWLVLVPRTPDAIEIVDLEPETRHRLMDEIAMASAALRSVTGAEKLNVAALGNQVAQLHVHVIARFRDDEAWPGPVWGAVPRKAYDKDARVDLIEKLSDAFQGR
ncbi:HIT family protein [Microbaculum marinisediminis]|uniref:HIT family protein n=1 Tax=Microbaculum marinisediminis TaxID=2931392 RepID=A0AAW5QS29_9HYPH|nr:HIT family protein [Microbaculum sp. A6E488]MCT8970856.1 HIT family protein [Microbaculum sp. A6E488]